MRVLEEYMEIICSSKDYHFGEFYVRFDRSFFPNENWMDFYILILAEWIRVIKKVEYKNLIDFRLIFCSCDGIN